MRLQAWMSQLTKKVTMLICSPKIASPAAVLRPWLLPVWITGLTLQVLSKVLLPLLSVSASCAYGKKTQGKAEPRLFLRDLCSAQPTQRQIAKYHTWSQEWASPTAEHSSHAQILQEGQLQEGQCSYQCNNSAIHSNSIFKYLILK